MHRLAHVQEGPLELETAILKISAQEHSDFHKNGKDFVNSNHVFRSTVRDVQTCTPSHAGSSDSWMLLVVHYPACRCVAACVPAREP